MRARSAVVAVLTGLLMILMLGASPVTRADETDNRHVPNFKGVDTYYWTTWRKGKGDCRFAWKLINSQYRFHRDYRARYVKVREFRAAKSLSSSCAGNSVHKILKHSHHACFGCNGNSPNWSRTYSYNFKWPYINRADFAMAHTMLKVAVKRPMNSSTQVIGRFCRSSFRLGTTPCP